MEVKHPMSLALAEVWVDNFLAFWPVKHMNCFISKMQLLQTGLGTYQWYRGRLANVEERKYIQNI